MEYFIKKIRKESHVKWQGESVFYIITLLTVALIWCIVLRMWEADWHIPFDYGTELGNDVFGSSTWIKSYIENGFSWEQNGFSVPFSTDRKTHFGVDRTVLLLEIVCSQIFSCYGSCLNTLYLMSFLITALAAVYSLRCLQFSRWISLSGAVLYTFLQYHLMRGEMHLYLSFYYSAPLAVLIMLWIVDESLFAEHFTRPCTGRFKNVHIHMLLFSLIIGLQQSYYSFYSAIGIAFALLYSLCQKKFVKAAESFTYLAVISITAILGNINALFHTSEITMEYMRQQRTVASIEAYGLKIVNLLLPVQNHRLTVLARLRQHYDSITGAGNNEGAWISLGLILSLCFIVSLTAFLPNKWADKRIRPCAAFILILVLISTVGGGSSLIGLVFSMLRCYNRMVVYIAMFCVIIFAVLAEKAGNILSVRKIPQGIQRSMLIFLTVFGIWDQTTPANVYAYGATKYEYMQDDKFVQAIEAEMPEGALIFELPMLPAGTTSVCNLSDYELYRPYLHARSTKWLHMYSVGSQTDQWVNMLRGFPLRTVIDIIACCDFQGVYLDSAGYSPEEWERVLTVMDSLENTDPVCSEDGQKVFYNLTDYAAGLKERLGPEKVKQYADFWLSCPDITVFSAASLFYTDKASWRGDGMAIAPGCIQYGPYITVQPGDYTAYIIGDNLEDMTCDFSCAAGEIQLPIHFTGRESNLVKYTFHVDAETYGAEMRCINGTDEDATIRAILLFRANQTEEMALLEDFLQASQQ